MKIIRRKLDHATISIDKPEYPIFAGITITNDDKIMFDWDKDSPRDVLKLAESTSRKFKNLRYSKVENSDKMNFYVYNLN